MTKLNHLKAIVFDWAGTTIDFGSCAPAAVFQQVFRERGIDITIAQARGPMGMAKREHIAAIANMPSVKEAWIAKYGRSFCDQDIDAMYSEFLPLQKQILGQHSKLIVGVPEVVAKCREMGLMIGSSTGYTRELMEIVSAAAREQGFEPDCVICSEDAPRGRPRNEWTFFRCGRLSKWTIRRLASKLAATRAAGRLASRVPATVSAAPSKN
jgi:phosphonoacetaldehyde hydrolase